ncbi:MAG TPA: hypothetical protein VFZ25_07070, partial [Chloroflexota bacterium]|nr:hypothetical protein [Chloroflexota bacterium]
CQAIEPAFAALQLAATTLDDYLTAGRYPDSGPDPSATEARLALQLAEQALALVRSQFPPEALP